MSIKSIIKRVDNTEYLIDIDYDEFWDSPREWRDGSFLCIRKHRRYDFPNELAFDFESFDEWEIELPELEENKKLFWLDCYEHSGVSFSLAGKGIQCKFDTSNKCGFIIAENEEQASQEIEDYNKYINWECYRLDISYRDIIIDKIGKEYISEWEYIDACTFLWWNNIKPPSQSPLSQEEWENFINS